MNHQTSQNGEQLAPFTHTHECLHTHSHLTHTHTHTHTHILSLLLLPQCKMDPDTAEPQDTLTPKAQQLIQDLGSQNTKVFNIVAEPDKAVVEAIRKELHKVNEENTFQAQRVCIPCTVLVELTSLVSMRVWRLWASFFKLCIYYILNTFVFLCVNPIKVLTCIVLFNCKKTKNVQP